MFMVVVWGVLAPAAGAGSLDRYYLERFGELSQGTSPVAGVHVESANGTSGVSERCGTLLWRGVTRDWSLLETGTQQTLAKYLAKPVLAGEAIVESGDGHFHIHYATSGDDAPPLADANADGIPDWVETVASVMEAIYTREVLDLGYQPAPTVGGQPYDIYLKNNVGGQVATYLGITQSDTPLSSTSYSSFITLDNDYAEFSVRYTPLQYLKVTAAHEYHHGIQYGYNFYFDSWYAEASSTWIEDEVYDSVNQLYDYLPYYLQNPGLALNISPSVYTGGGYGRWVFNRYLAEINGRAVVRSVWENLKLIPRPADGSDIPMIPVIDTVLGGAIDQHLAGLGKRFVMENWASHLDEISLIHPVTTVAGATTVSSYPTNSYSFSFLKYESVTAQSATLTIAFTGKPAGVAAVAFRQNGGGSFSEFAYDPATATIVVPGWSIAAPVVLMLCNNVSGTTTAPADPTGVIASLPDAQAATAKSPTLVSGPTVVSATGESGGGGCFIATAAYGSYLHPKVRLLREFRDRWLLTNRAGRWAVACYYRISPPLARIIARHGWMRSCCRAMLTPVVLAVEYPLGGTAVMAAGFPGLLLIWRRRGSAGADSASLMS